MPEIQIKAHDGGTFNAYIAYPDVTPAPAVIMIQEIFGINQEMREKCDAMAAQGYIGIAPDLFWRIEPGIELVDSVAAELERAFQLFGEFDVPMGLKDLISTLSTIKGHEKCNGKAACIGYCLGGKLAYMMAAHSDVDASVSYYGVGLHEMLGDADNFKHPVLIHIAGEDEFTPKDTQDKIIEALRDNSLVKTHRYAGMDHAFARGGGMHYNKDAADLANARTADFLKDNLKTG